MTFRPNVPLDDAAVAALIANSSSATNSAVAAIAGQTKLVTTQVLAGTSGQIAAPGLISLISVELTASGRIRLYSTQANRDSDSSRNTTTIPDVNAGVLYDFVADGPIMDYPSIIIDTRPGNTIFWSGAATISWTTVA